MTRSNRPLQGLSDGPAGIALAVEFPVQAGLSAQNGFDFGGHQGLGDIDIAERPPGVDLGQTVFGIETGFHVQFCRREYRR